MALDLSESDYCVLDTFLNTILDEYKNGNLTQLYARSLIAEAVAQAALDNGYIVTYMKGVIETKGKDY